MSTKPVKVGELGFETRFFVCFKEALEMYLKNEANKQKKDLKKFHWPKNC